MNYLLEAPRITREAAGMSWTFLDAPQDGTVMLVWQPLAHMGTTAASDGYLWADPEQAFSSEAKGYVRLRDAISEGDSTKFKFGRLWKCTCTEVAIIPLTNR